MQTTEWTFDVTRMSWDEWRAAAIRIGSFERAIDGPYRDTAEEALSDLKKQMGLVK